MSKDSRLKSTVSKTAPEMENAAPEAKNAAPNAENTTPATSDVSSISQSDLYIQFRIALAAILLLSLGIFTYERTLIPIYASGPTNDYLHYYLALGLALAIYRRPKLSITQKLLVSGTVLALAPNATYYLAIWSARYRDPLWGPTFVHVLVLMPLVYSYGMFLPHEQVMSVWGSLVASFMLWKRAWPSVLQLRSISDNQIYLPQALLAFSIAIWCMDFSKPNPVAKGNKPAKKPKNDNGPVTKLLIIGGFVAIALTPLSSPLYSPILPHPYPETYTDSRVPYQIHFAVQSNTGLIEVGEILTPPEHDPQDVKAMHSVRFLRAAHSILGGMWMGPRVMDLGDGHPHLKDSYGTDLGDSIYGAFDLQEAARLVVREKSKGKGKGRALVIGLGVGVSTTALYRHGMNLTIVEIDPAVYEAARRFFGVPDPGEGNAFLEDAGAWVAARATQRRNVTDTFEKDTEDLYDIVVHDCFSGGGVPQHLYTIEFWENLKTLVKDDGVVVINFAGEVDSEASRHVLKTLDAAFPQCRAFHDLMDPHGLTSDKYWNEFINVVFFCTPAAEPEMTFRPPTSADYLGSPLRRHVFTTLMDREVNLNVLRESMERIKNEEGKETRVLSRSEGYNPLGLIQKKQASRHWKLMREVLPDIYWEIF
ncbi:spermine spermidine synthase [Moniliophthora roreri MCA 2997]|uniref:Spermine spermidine synthase n=1 Tax=Moniliophthora roreri (strain MCA 2997) TaxID=1381753 RepID=V2X5R2_MONRO|nr:spermine spermidine synthase [Moniliophthora roreri MCA 2997]